MILLVAVASAVTLTGSSETVAQVRPDMTGEPFVGVSEYLDGSAEFGTTLVEGYGVLGWPSGVDQPIVPELYVLSADGSSGAIDWTLGRQRIDLPTFGRLFDGGRAAWAPNGSARVEGWLGYARHVGLDGVTAGAPVARLVGSYVIGGLQATGGVWGELGTAPAIHPDLRARYRGKGSFAPDIGLVAALGVGDTTVLERGRLDFSFRPLGGVHAMVWGEHREALPGISQLGPSILYTLAPEGTEEVGAGVGWTDVKKNELWGSASVQTWAPDALDGEDPLALAAELAWRPNCDARSLCFRPSWRGMSGRGGYYSAFMGAVTLPSPDVLDLDVYGLVAPYQKPHEPVDSVAAAGLTVGVHPTSFLAITAGGELARDTISPLSPRGWLTLRLDQVRK